MKNKTLLLFLCLLFIAPGLLALLFYRHPEWIKGGINKGTLITPAPLFSPYSIKQRQWHLVFWYPTSCDNVCLKEIKRLRRVRLALGRRYYQVDTWLLQPQVLTKKGLPLPSFLSKTPLVFIVTPDHHWMLSYPLPFKMDDVYHDLKHLLINQENNN